VGETLGGGGRGTHRWQGGVRRRRQGHRQERRWAEEPGALVIGGAA
jgi:hypothetical protein